MQIDDENKLTEGFEALMRYALKNAVITNGIISNVRPDVMLVDVMISNQLFNDVPLKVLVGKQPTIIEIPADQSPCLVCLRNANYTTPQILMIQDVEQYILKINDLTFQITTDGFKFVNQSSGLKNTLKNLINELINFKIVTPAGEGVTDPTTITNLNQYLTDLDNYLID